MGFPFYLRSFMLRICAACCVAASAASLCAQTQPPQVILELNACGDLKVFEDGKVLESRDGKTTERRLSESRMRSLRKTIVGAPCSMEWKQRPAAPPDLHSTPSATVSPGSDCEFEWLGYGAGLIEVKLNLHYLEHQTGPFHIYIVCERAKQSDKDWAKRVYQRVLRRNWQRFVKDVVSATDSKSVITDCDCRRH